MGNKEKASNCSKILIKTLTGIIIAMFLSIAIAAAHESRPATLDIYPLENDNTIMQLVFRTPIFSRMKLPVILEFPKDVQEIKPAESHNLQEYMIERYVIRKENGLSGTPISFPGLQLTITDVIVRQHFNDGTYQTSIVRPSNPTYGIIDDTPQQWWMVLYTYSHHGLLHILDGYDHLLFICALLVLLKRLRTVVATITAFTIAHSITLSLSALDVIDLPTAPIEACIAISILLLGYEATRLYQGKMSLSIQKPWIIAFSFGLLHGLAFAGALEEIGLPRKDIPLALISFNVGVEIGQLSVIILVFLMVQYVKKLPYRWIHSRRWLQFLGYGIGITASFWFWERIFLF